MEFLEGRKTGTRSHQLVLAFAAHMLVNGGIASSLEDGHARASAALDSGAALDLFGRMVHALGGPPDFSKNWKQHLPVAPVIRPIWQRRGLAMSAPTRRAQIGLAVIALGGGRLRPEDGIDPRTGFTAIMPIGTFVEKGEPLAFVHAADESYCRDRGHGLSEMRHARRMRPCRKRRSYLRIVS